MSIHRPGHDVVVVFAKEPSPGRVKTRLAPHLSSQGAADLYGCMLDDVLETTARVAREECVDAVLAVDPPAACSSMTRRAPAPFRVVAQRGPDLAARMTHAVAACAAGGARRIVLRGSDSPALPAARLVEAFAALDGADLVACPDPDGGYSLLGVRRPLPDLFDHAMSHGHVLEQTLERAARAGWSTTRVEPCFDLDTADDLALLAQARREGAELPCPRTLRWLDDQQAWPNDAP